MIVLMLLGCFQYRLGPYQLKGIDTAVGDASHNMEELPDDESSDSGTGDSVDNETQSGEPSIEEPSSETSTEPSTESIELINGGFEDDGGMWSFFPPAASNYEFVSTGDGIYDPTTGSTSTDIFFTAIEGTKAIKMWTGNTFFSYQEFDGFVEGDSIFLSAKSFVSSLDPIDGESTFGQLLIKAYNENYIELAASTSSTLVDSTTTIDEWQDLSSELIVPTGTLYVQIGVEIVVGNDSVGSLYFDDLQMSYSSSMAQ